MTHDTDLSDLFKLLAHPFRVELLRLLAQEESACVCHIEALTGQRQAYISQHLAKLRDASLVEDERDGMNVYYALTSPAILDVITRAQDVWGAIVGSPMVLAPLKTAQEVTCSCPTCQTEHITLTT